MLNASQRRYITFHSQAIKSKQPLLFLADLCMLLCRCQQLVIVDNGHKLHNALLKKRRVKESGGEQDIRAEIMADITHITRLETFVNELPS